MSSGGASGVSGAGSSSRRILFTYLTIMKMMKAMMRKSMTGTMLRGTVNKDGSLHSFWVKGEQKNLISLLFELPTQSVKKGDSWTLNNVSLINNDQRK